MPSSASYSETGRIAQTLQETFSGGAWHGSAVIEILQGVTAGQALQRPVQHAHSIWELVLHMTSWRIFTWNKLAGDREFDITEPTQDWPPVTEETQPDWDAAVQALIVSQQQLLKALAGVSDEKLEEIVPGREYDYYKLLHGIIQHDLYHAGQIALLKKALR